MSKSLICFIVAFIVLPVTPAFSQTRWFKYEGNPVLDVGLTGAWDNSGARIDRVIFQDSVYHAWYTGYTGGEPGPTVFPRAGYASSLDGVIWTKDSSNPVLNPGPATWDNEGSFRPYVILSDSNYKMWYTGVACCPAFRIGHATSLDGRVWTKHPNPVLSPFGSWNAGGVEHASVVEDGIGGYEMWFQGVNSTFQVSQFGFAAAANETIWTPSSNPVFSDVDIVYYPRVILNEQLYEMWYGITTHPNSRFKYATSPDGINWTISSENPVLRPGPQAWDAGGIIPGDISFDGSIYHMWYQGRSTSGWRSGYAVSPKGMAPSVTPQSLAVGDTVWVRAQVDSAVGLSFSAEIEKPDGNVIDLIELFDDGVHGDSVAGDGIFGNSWVPAEAHTYFVDLKLQWNTRSFEMNNAGTVNVIITDVAELSTLPKSFFLGQNYPNPFNPSTEIQFSMPHRSHVTLTIFDLSGREVATLVSEELAAGSYSTRWNPAGFPSGTYFYRLQVGEFVETKKLLLLR